MTKISRILIKKSTRTRAIKTTTSRQRHDNVTTTSIEINWKLRTRLSDAKITLIHHEKLEEFTAITKRLATHCTTTTDSQDKIYKMYSNNQTSLKTTSAKWEIPRGSPGPAPNMGAWDSQTLPYDPRGQHASARGRPGATGAKIPMLGANGVNETLSEPWS